MEDRIDILFSILPEPWDMDPDDMNIYIYFYCFFGWGFDKCQPFS